MYMSRKIGLCSQASILTPVLRLANCWKCACLSWRQSGVDDSEEHILLL